MAGRRGRRAQLLRCFPLQGKGISLYKGFPLMTPRPDVRLRGGSSLSVVPPCPEHGPGIRGRTRLGVAAGWGRSPGKPSPRAEQ